MSNYKNNSQLNGGMAITFNQLPEIPELDRYILSFLPNPDAVHFAITTKSRHINTNNEIKRREYKDISRVILQYLRVSDYRLFAIHLSKLYSKFNDHISYQEQLNELLISLLNEIEVPAVWITQSSGYYDIRYFFELVYYGAQIERTDLIKRHFVYDRYYNYFTKMRNNIITNDKYNKETMIYYILDGELGYNGLANTIYDTTLNLLRKDFSPEPKNKYNQNFITPLMV